MNLGKLLFGALVFATPFITQATRIVVLADVHVVPGNECELKLKEAVSEINLLDTDIVVMNGDLTNEGSDGELSNIKLILDEIKHPLYVLPGNHETTWSQSATKTIFDLWGNDRFVTEVDDLVIVGIACGPYMKMGDGHIKQEDLHWLSSTLKEKVKDGKRVVSFNHYPLMKDLDNYIDYVKVLENYPVVAHVNGHYHKYEYYKGGDIDCMMVRSLDKKNGDYGYTIMDITADSVMFYNKQLEKEPVKVNSFAIDTQISPIQEKYNTTFNIPEGYSIEKIYADSASIFTRLGIDSDAIYFGNSLGVAKAIDKNSGNELWRINTGASLFARPIAFKNDFVVVPSSTKELLWVDKKRGVTVKRTMSDGPYVADGLCVKNDYYQGGYKMMEKWNAKTGNLIWRYDSINNYCQAAPVVTGDDLIFGAWDTYLYCLNTKTGQLNWKWNNGKKNNQLGPGNVVPVVSKDKVIVVAPDRYMTAIDRKTGKTIWRNKDHKYRESLGVSKDGKCAYAKTMDGELVAVSTEGNEFNELWLVDMELGYEHAPCIVAESRGIVYAGSRRGIVTAVNPKTKTVEWSLPLGVSEINGIDIDTKTGDVYVSLIEGTIWKISKK